MNEKTVIIFIVSVAFFTLAATYRFHDSAHAMGMLKKGGGMARHPALLDKDKDNYMLIATAGVVPPYQGNARVVLEGDPFLTATFYNSEPAVDIGIHRHPAFRDNTYYDLRPKDRIALWVKIKRRPVAAQQPAVVVQQKQTGHEAAPVCSQCEPEDVGAATKTNGYAGPAKKPGGKTNDSVKSTDLGVTWKSKGPDTTIGSGSKWHGKKAGAMSAQGPALAFYDVATNEPLLRVPIRFTGGAGGGVDDH